MKQGLVQIADARLLASIDASMAEAARRSGDWLVCRVGCTQCCMGPFPITQLDVLRLREGFDRIAPATAERVRARAAAYIEHISSEYPGDPESGELVDEDALPESMDSMACPALDPESGRCELYEWRPVTCRCFGAATRIADGAIAACELCYTGATEDEMERCAVQIDPDGLEAALLTDLADSGVSGTTIVAYAIARS